MPIPQFAGNAVELFIPGTAMAIGTYDFGPWQLGGFSGFKLDITRSASTASGTAAITLMVNDPTLLLQNQLDGAGANIGINDWAAAEHDRRILQVHPTAGPMPSSDVDGVFTQGNHTYYRQPVADPFTLRLVLATGTSTFSGALLHFLK